MGYQGGSHAMLSEAAHMGYAAGSSSGLGDFSSSMESAALAAGVAQQSDLDLLNSVGATDQDLTNLINGNITLAQLYANYGIQFQSATSTPGSASVASAPTSPSVPAAQVPSGSTILYTATVVGGPGDLTVSPDSAMSQFSSALSQHGMTVVSSTNDETVLNKLFGTGAAIHFQFQILDTIGNNFVSDAKSVCDAVLEGIVGNNITTSNLSVVSTPAGAGASPSASPTTNFGAWLQNNALYLGLGVGALVLLNNFTSGKRR
jgi:hypothetical protein